MTEHYENMFRMYKEVHPEITREEYDILVNEQQENIKEQKARLS